MSGTWGCVEIGGAVEINSDKSCECRASVWRLVFQGFGEAVAERDRGYTQKNLSAEIACLSGCSELTSPATGGAA